MTELGLPDSGLFVGRVYRPGLGPSLVLRRGDRLIDITARAAPTMAHLLALPDPAGYAAAADGEDVGSLADWEAATRDAALARDGECASWRPPTSRRSRHPASPSPAA